jgi:hypothetical protein
MMFRRILIAAWIVLACRQAIACSCVVLPGPDNTVLNADVVFVGRVTAIEPEAQPKFEPGKTQVLAWGPGYGVHVSFEIAKPVKGTRDRNLSLWTGYGGGDCGVTFQPALTYIVLARYNSQGTLIASICSGTGWLGYRYVRERYDSLIGDFKFSDPEPYDLAGMAVSGPVLIGPRVPELAQMDDFPVVLEIDRQGRVTHFSFDGVERCTACCAEKRARLAKYVPLWRFQPAILDGEPVAVRIRRLSRATIRTTGEQARNEQSRIDWERKKFEEARLP